MLSLQRHRNEGFTLTELMVGMVVSLIIVGGVLTVYTATLATSSDNMQAARLNHDLRALMNIIVRDLRRAGYAAIQPNADNDGDGDVDNDDLSYNPFTSSMNDVQTGQFVGETANSCIIYTYNADEDSPARVGVCSTCSAADLSPPFNAAPYDTGNIDMFGFRLRDGAVEMRRGLTNTSETTFDCNSGRWLDATVPETEITALSFALTATPIVVTDADGNGTCSSGDACQFIREVNVTLSGRLAGDTLVQQTITERVLLRNDRFVSTVP